MFRSCICVLVGVVLTVAVEPETPAPGPPHDEAKAKVPDRTGLLAAWDHGADEGGGRQDQASTPAR